jgi:hypothetical protein
MIALICGSSRMDFDDFTSVDFSPRQEMGFVYVFCFVEGRRRIPFYVGQTQSIWGRLNDYHWADFQASTDFRVGEAAKYLSTKNIRVVAKYRASADRSKDEKAIIKRLQKEGWLLLNDCQGYNYRKAIPETERAKVQEFMENILKSVRR